MYTKYSNYSNKYNKSQESINYFIKKIPKIKLHTIIMMHKFYMGKNMGKNNFDKYKNILDWNNVLNLDNINQNKI